MMSTSESTMDSGVSIARMKDRAYPNEKRITLLFRFDDFGQTTDERLESRLFDLFVDSRLSCLIGVIPFIGKGRIALAGEEFHE